jgi:hypothetical protein
MEPVVGKGSLAGWALDLLATLIMCKPPWIPYHNAWDITARRIARENGKTRFRGLNPE